MATIYILDTSVAVKWFARKDEEHIEQAEKVFSDIENGTIEVFTPDFFLVEFVNALLFGKKLDPETVINSCKILLKSRINFFPVSSSVLFSGISFTKKYRLTIYDALFISLADYKKCKIITADTKIGNVSKYALLIENYV